MNRAALCALAVVALLTVGCSESDFAGARLPLCGAAGARSTFLMAQAVPDATLVPCIAPDTVPASWSVEAMRIDSAGARLAFIGDMTSAAPQRIDVRFSSACDVGGAVPVPSDEQDTERYEHVDSIAAGYVGQRFYVFDGGCVTYRFDTGAEGWSGFVHEASTVFTFMPRAEVVRLRDVALARP